QNTNPRADALPSAFYLGAGDASYHQSEYKKPGTPTDAKCREKLGGWAGQESHTPLLILEALDSAMLSIEPLSGNHRKRDPARGVETTIPHLPSDLPINHFSESGCSSNIVNELWSQGRRFVTDMQRKWRMKAPAAMLEGVA